MSKTVTALCFTFANSGKYSSIEDGKLYRDKEVKVPAPIINNVDKCTGFMELQRSQGIGEVWFLDTDGNYDFCLSNDPRDEDNWPAEVCTERSVPWGIVNTEEEIEL